MFGQSLNPSANGQTEKLRGDVSEIQCNRQMSEPRVSFLCVAC